MVPRSWFDARLNAHIENPQSAEEDPSWYALRNVIYAFGSRIYMTGKSSFIEIGNLSWSLFENALSVQLDITYRHTSLRGVQALALMVIRIISPNQEFANV